MRVILFTVVLLGSLCAVPVVCGAAVVAGAHDGVTRWKKDDGVVTLVGNVEFTEDSTLIIESGVHVEMLDGASLASVGAVYVYGTEQEPVVFDGGLLSVSTYFNASNVIFHDMADVSFYDADVLLREATSTGITALSAYRSRVQIAESYFESSTNDALGLYDSTEALVASSTFRGRGFGSGLALYDSFADVQFSRLCADDISLAVYSARRSNFDHAGAAVRNSSFCSPSIVYVDDRFAEGRVDARNNWWGSPDSPRGVGPVLTEPWLVQDPFVKPLRTVLFFLPGIEASRLYATGTVLGLENQLWEPNRNGDVTKLFFATTGQPKTNDHVYTRDIIDELNSLSSLAGGSPNIYKSLVKLFDSLVTDGVVHAWHPLPYDWRYSADDVAQNIFSSVEQFSGEFDRVVFVAHSNGGLVVRHVIELAQRLPNSFLAKVLKLYFVAVPHEGTPQAAVSLLHGHALELLGGLILKSSIAQQLAQTIPGAYGLLPTPLLLGSLKDQFIDQDFSFLTDAVLVDPYPFLERYGSTTARVAAATPSILDQVRDEQQRINYPLTIPSVTIVGDGLRTVYGIRYLSVDSCKRGTLQFSIIQKCTPHKKIIIDPLTTLAGDGTVLSASARTLRGEKVEHVFFDLAGYNAQLSVVSRAHADITEAGPMLDFIKSSLKGETTYIPFVATSSERFEQNRAAGYQRALMVSVHSPVLVDAYDARGNHTGRLPHPTSFETTDVTEYETNIPASTYWEIGESKYLIMPEAALSSGARVELRGVGSGLVTVIVEALDGDQVAWRRVIEDVPTVPELVTTVSIDASVTGSGGASGSAMGDIVATTTFPGGGVATSSLAELATSTAAAVLRYGPAVYCRSRSTGELEPRAVKR